MNVESSTTRCEQQVEQAVTRAVTDIRSTIEYFNDKVVPDVRRSAASALRAGSVALDRWAKGLEAGQGPLSKFCTREDARR